VHGNLLARQPHLVVPGKQTVLSVELCLQPSPLHPSLVGHSLHPSLVGHSLHPSLVGNSLHPSLVGHSLHPSLVGHSLHPSLVGHSLHPSLVGHSLHPRCPLTGEPALAPAGEVPEVSGRHTERGVLALVGSARVAFQLAAPARVAVVIADALVARHQVQALAVDAGQGGALVHVLLAVTPWGHESRGPFQ
jgi:hypothetical protein